MDERRRDRRIWWGSMLIVLGIIFLVQQYGFFQVPGWVFIAAPGLVFAISYALTRSRGMLVPAGVLLGLAAGIAIEGETGARNGVGVLGGLGLGFIAIFAVDWLVTRVVIWWPLIPGGILLVIASLLAIGNRELWRLLGTLWPIGLIVVGLIVLAQYWRAGQNKQDMPS